MNIYRQTNYREIFAQLFENERGRRPGWSTAQLAQQIRVQPSYLTNVVRERAHFSSDQIYAIGSQLNLSAVEIRYLDLLMIFERAEFPERRQVLQNEIHAIRDKEFRTEKRLRAPENRLSELDREKYYLDPNIELMHLYLGIKGAPKEITKIAQAWGLSTDYVAQIITFLEKVDLVKTAPRGWKVQGTHQLLSPQSHLAKPHQILKRIRALETIQKISAEKIYSFSGTLTINEETRLQIQSLFVEFLEKCEKASLASSEEGIYHLQFDLFPWLNGRA